MSSRSIRLLFALVAALLLAACSKDPRDPCLQPREAVVRMRCVHSVDSVGTLGDTLLPNPLLTPIESQSSYVFGGVKRISQFPLSLSGVADSCRWILRPDSASSVADTLSFHYQRNLHFISNACGYTYFYHLDRISSTRHAIDSALLIKSEVSIDATSEHIRLIF